MLTRKLKALQAKRKIIPLIIVFFLLVITGAFDIYSQFKYARDLEIIGVIVDIQWKTHNHNLPRIVILDDGGKSIAISQFTIALNPSTIKIGDRIVKKKGSEFCIINEREVRFSLY